MTRTGPAPLTAFALVGLGGAVGTSLRYGADLLAPTLGPLGPVAPELVATLTVNLIGSFLLGFLVGRLGALTSAGALSHDRHARLRLLLGTGLLGGFTTYSAFALEAVTTAQAGAVAIAIGYVVVSVAAGAALAVAGLRTGRRARPRRSTPSSGSAPTESAA